MFQTYLHYWTKNKHIQIQNKSLLITSHSFNKIPVTVHKTVVLFVNPFHKNSSPVFELDHVNLEPRVRAFQKYILDYNAVAGQIENCIPLGNIWACLGKGSLHQHMVPQIRVPVLLNLAPQFFEGWTLHIIFYNFRNDGIHTKCLGCLGCHGGLNESGFLGKVL